MNRLHICSICDKNCKVLCVIQHKFNVLVNTPLTSINTNYILLVSSSSTNITWTDGTSDTNVKDVMAADATSGKKKLYKTLYTMSLHLHMHLHILKNGQKGKKYSSHILRYMNIY